ncbi:MAG: hypothetical protein M1821_000582 [Bathelium mastoideum]|nr:MAG: hypothetical protein M1821_000582 [Bathelium mastoideum]
MLANWKVLVVQYFEFVAFKQFVELAHPAVPEQGLGQRFLSLDGLDETFTLTQVGECTTGEIAAGIVVGNLVCLPKFFKNYGHLISSYYRSNQKSENTAKSNEAYKDSQSWPRLRNDDQCSPSRQKQDAENKAGNYFELKDVPGYQNCSAASGNREDFSSFDISTVSSHNHPQNFLEDEYGDDRRRLWPSVHAKTNLGHA